MSNTSFLANNPPEQKPEQSQGEKKNDVQSNDHQPLSTTLTPYAKNYSSFLFVSIAASFLGINLNL